MSYAGLVLDTRLAKVFPVFKNMANNDLSLWVSGKRRHILQNVALFESPYIRTTQTRHTIYEKNNETFLKSRWEEMLTTLAMMVVHPFQITLW